MDYNAPTGSTDPNAGYVGKTSSTLGSKVPPKAAEFPQREIVNAELGAGLTPSNNDLTQLIQAIAIGIDCGTFGGTANALTATLPGAIAIPALRTGMVFWGLVGASTNSGAATLTINGFNGAPGPKPIVRRDGTTALTKADLLAGDLVAFRFDGTSFRYVGLTLSGLASFGITNIGSANYQFFTTAGSTTWTSPIDGLVRASGRGGGGGGGGATGSCAAGAGGNAGATFEGVFAVTKNTVYAISIGAAGAGGAGGLVGGNGGTTSLAALASAGGGAGGSGGNNSGGSTGAGNTATGGAINIGGASGGYGWASSSLGIAKGGEGGAGLIGPGFSPACLSTIGLNGYTNAFGGGGTGGAAIGASAYGGAGGAGYLLLQY